MGGIDVTPPTVVMETAEDGKWRGEEKEKRKKEKERKMKNNNNKMNEDWVELQNVSEKE